MNFHIQAMNLHRFIQTAQYISILTAIATDVMRNGCANDRNQIENNQVK